MLKSFCYWLERTLVQPLGWDDVACAVVLGAAGAVLAIVLLSR